MNIVQVCTIPVWYFPLSLVSGIPTPEEPDDETVLEQLKNVPHQNEVRWCQL